MLDIDTDSPERRLVRIKEWLEKKAAHKPIRSRKKFIDTIKSVLQVIKLRDSNNDEVLTNIIMGILTKSYKRDYDRYRVLKFIIESMQRFCATNHLESLQMNIEMLPINELVRKVVKDLRKVDVNKLETYILTMYEGRL
ncbi:MAG: hypothetical protein NDF55_00075 [archaeon GB-1867-005]|nr:hypothetical protein [Candidatus Culexmicrobium cathedralense]